MAHPFNMIPTLREQGISFYCETILVSDIHTFINPFFSHKSPPSNHFGLWYSYLYRPILLPQIPFLQPFWFVIFIPLSTHSSPTNPLLSTILVSDIHTFINPFFSHKSPPNNHFGFWYSYLYRTILLPQILS